MIIIFSLKHLLHISQCKKTYWWMTIWLVFFFYLFLNCFTNIRTLDNIWTTLDFGGYHTQNYTCFYIFHWKLHPLNHTWGKILNEKYGQICFPHYLSQKTVCLMLVKMFNKMSKIKSVSLFCPPPIDEDKNTYMHLSNFFFLKKRVS